MVATNDSRRSRPMLHRAPFDSEALAYILGSRAHTRLSHTSEARARTRLSRAYDPLTRIRPSHAHTRLSYRCEDLAGVRGSREVKQHDEEPPGAKKGARTDASGPCQTMSNNRSGRGSNSITLEAVSSSRIRHPTARDEDRECNEAKDGYHDAKCNHPPCTHKIRLDAIQRELHLKRVKRGG